MGVINAVIRSSIEGQVVTPIELPPVELPPVEVEDDLDHDDFGPSVEACVWALVLLAAGWLALRLYLKVRKHRGLWWDDHFLTIESKRSNVPKLLSRYLSVTSKSWHELPAPQQDENLEVEQEYLLTIVIEVMGLRCPL
ncbi:hypothetical protein ONZ43_g4044 [Nemania bipapillata]|uniref:Uncharacterized protein n=1 Tax=Nemania bipapillata TaxID=110536 RepID=A0ACC2ISW0_9PEZI|nr:hypothetical protein ONZ43_g4044 [Nemania bipapillata]